MITDSGKKGETKVMKKQLLINGEWINAETTVTLYSPYTGDPIAEVPAATKREVNLAIEAAVGAKEVMRRMPAHRRAAILERLASLLNERREEAARLIALEAAKPLKTALNEVDRTVQTYKFAAEEAKRIHGETIPLDAAPGGENRLAYTVREPVGVVGAITPFNFPMNLVAHKVGPAIASGNTIVLKPAAQTPLSAYFLGELLQQAGLPAGALNIVTGSGKVIGDMIVTDPRVAKITFTGSPEVGISIRSKAGLKRVTLELGSNSALIIDKDVDFDPLISRCVTGAFAFQGQVCISLQRIYVIGDKYEEFTKKFIEAAGKLQIGDPLHPDTDVSAMISQKDVQRSLDWIEEAKQQGASVAAGGTAEGGILHPTVLLNVNPGASVSCKEVFAPIVLINRANSLSEAIAYVNDSDFGLQAGIYTNNINTALDAADQLHVGGVMINDIPTFRVDHMPYGGVKQSGMGREGIKYAVEEMTEMKLIVINRG
jgi:acyl-CoA reductase-like NAD-dependent aldehyde dehydrogenase